MKTYLNPAEIESSLPNEALLKIDTLPYPHISSGKVRELYDTGDAYLMIASDRLSAFDVILPDGIPGKGIILTQISLYWFEHCKNLIPNHLVDNHNEALLEVLGEHKDLAPRCMLVKKLKPLPIEAVVRRYLSGSGWKHYLKTNNLFGHPLKPGLLESAKLETPLFTPTTKAAVGDHDEPINYPEGVDLLGKDRFEEVQDVSLKLFALGTSVAKEAGLILADTKFEFGVDGEDTVHLIDEALTPDSSRYWPAADYKPGGPQIAFDKQFVRDYLETLDWDKTSPGPSLPQEIIDQTQKRYLDAVHKLMPN